MSIQKSCDLLKIHYLCGDKDNQMNICNFSFLVVICSKFITFAVTKTIPYFGTRVAIQLWFAQNSLPLRWQRQSQISKAHWNMGCDLLKIHYLCGDKDNTQLVLSRYTHVVICSKFITFAVTKTIRTAIVKYSVGCDLLKIHYLCGDKDNFMRPSSFASAVVICSKFITFAVTKTMLVCETWNTRKLWFAQNSLPLRWQRQLHTAVDAA